MAASKHLSEMQNDLPKSENVKPVQKKHETLAFRALQMTRKEEKQRKKAKKTTKLCRREMISLCFSRTNGPKAIRERYQ